MAETPYELMARKSKQRKNELLSSIQHKNFKHRSISYNLKISNDLQQDPEVKAKESQKHERQTRMNFSSCLKKSYYYRKFLNKTADGQLTQQEFNKLKETFNKISLNHSQKYKNPAIFREIWEKQIKRKYSLRLDGDRDLQMSVKCKKNQKNSDDLPVINLGQQRKIIEVDKRKFEDLSEIAKRRKMNLDFDLQILGNKKHLKAKEFNISHFPIKAQNLNSDKDIDVQDVQIGENQNQTLTQIQSIEGKTKPACTFFKRFRQAMSNQPAQQINNFRINIKKLEPNQRNFIQNYKVNGSTNLNLKKQEESKFFGWNSDQKAVRICQNSSQIRHHRYQVQTSQKPRISVKRYKKFLAGCNYANDIQGWNVKHEHQDENNETFAT